MLRHDANEASGLAAAPAPDLGRRPETTTAQYHKCSSRDWRSRCADVASRLPWDFAFGAGLAGAMLSRRNRNRPGRHAMVRTLEQSTMRKVYLRLLPFAILTYFFCYLDRINVGFAALTMNKDLGLDPAIFGMAAGAFFWGYCLFEVPSNMIMEKVGATLWLE